MHFFQVEALHLHHLPWVGLPNSSKPAWSKFHLPCLPAVHHAAWMANPSSFQVGGWTLPSWTLKISKIDRQWIPRYFSARNYSRSSRGSTSHSLHERQSGFGFKTNWKNCPYNQGAPTLFKLWWNSLPENVQEVQTVPNNRCQFWRSERNQLLLWSDHQQWDFCKKRKTERKILLVWLPWCWPSDRGFCQAWSQFLPLKQSIKFWMKIWTRLQNRINLKLTSCTVLQISWWLVFKSWLLICPLFRFPRFKS